ncbi:MAG TPA: HAD family hydrolase [Deltaproteobacteria bacterium]|nr:HAD family hydrolase [Deltaproteobacteria bacterium]
MGQSAAFFDMDHTIIWENSGLSSVRFARKHGLITLGHLMKGIVKITLYRLSLMNIEAWYEKNMGILSGMTIEDMDHFSSLWFDAMIRKSIYKEAADLIGEHTRKGHRVVIITNAPPFFVKPVAETLAITDIICTQVEVKDGVFTGKLIKPLCYGQGKFHYASVWAGNNDIDMGSSYFYTDSYYDIELMKAVGNPIATNPDRKLIRTASENNWPILFFKKRSAFP